MEGFDLGTASAIYVGDQPCSAVYLGNDKVWGGGIDYSKEYFTIEVVEDGTITIVASSASIAKTISYSTDEGNTWNNLTTSTTAQSLGSFNAGDTIMLKGTNTAYGNNSSDNNKFGGTAKYNVYGNIMSLLYGDDFSGKTTFPSGSTYTFNSLFSQSAGLIDASDLVLPATTLVHRCYRYMFYRSGLTTAPELPATTLAEYCYEGMFDDCASLTTAPSILPATTLAQYCYYYMFHSCKSLTTAPILPATTLSNSCYHYMFGSCSNLTTAPELPAISLVKDCYKSMFSYCTKLNYIKAMFTTTPGSGYTTGWVQSVAATGTFVKNSAATWNVTGKNGIPSGWTVQTADA